MPNANMKSVMVTPRTFQVLWEASGRKPPSSKPLLEQRPIFLQLTDVSEADIERLEKAETKDEVKQILAVCLSIDQSDGFRKEIMADLYFHSYGFCSSCKLSPIKTSCFLSIMKIVLEEAVAKRLPSDGAFSLFKEWLLKHGVERPPKSVGIFDFEEIQKILDYVHNTFFRHYRLYLYVFMTHSSIAFRAEDRDVGLIVPSHSSPLPLLAASELEAKSQPEFAHLFAPEPEQAEGDRDKPEDRATIIKRKVDEGVKKLMERFENNLKDQDGKFSSLLEAQ